MIPQIQLGLLQAWWKNDTTDTARSASGMVETMIPQIQLGLLQAWWKNDTTDTARSASGIVEK